jgi:two-component system OmpR family response regulator
VDQGCRIVLAGAESALRQRLHEACIRAGLVVEITTQGRAAIQRAQDNTADIVVILSDLGDFSASELVRSLRHERDVGVIVISPDADSTDRVIQLELGADEVLSGELLPRELIARMRNLFKRMRPAVAPARNGGAFRFGGWMLDAQLRQLTAPHNEPVHLTSREYEVLEILLRRANEVVSREDLRGSGPANQDSRAVDVLVGRLRRKLDDRGEFARMIKPVRNVGYILTQQVELLAA